MLQVKAPIHVHHRVEGRFQALMFKSCSLGSTGDAFDVELNVSIAFPEVNEHVLWEVHR
jgi:hypothetical protein